MCKIKTCPNCMGGYFKLNQFWDGQKYNSPETNDLI